MTLLPLMSLLSTAAATWEELPPLPEPNGGGHCGVCDSKIVVIGGTNWNGGTKNWLRSVHEYEPKTRQWQAKSPMKRPVAYGLSPQSPRGFSFVGGTDGKQARKAIGTFDGTGVVFAEEPTLPASVVLSAGGWIGERIIIVGGTDDPANLAGITRMTHAAANGVVKRLADYPGKPLAVAASATMGDELFVFGGMNYDAASQGPMNAAEAYAFSPTKNEWRALKPLKAANRGLSAVALDDRHIYLAGGFTDAFTTEGVIYDVKTDSYRAAPPLPYAAMVTLLTCDGFLYCLGGEDKMKSRTDKFFRIPMGDLLK